jgi:RND family efflux transporter MFP subunit
MRSIRLVVCVVTAELLVSACKGGQGAGQTGGAAFPPSTVTVAAAHTTDIEDATEYVATLKSLHSTAIQPQIDGQIVQIYVKSGERVKEGVPLMQIDPRRQQAAVSSQEAERAAREASVGYARQQAQRATDLYAAGAISRQELEQAETALKTAQADLDALQAQVRQQQAQLRYYTVAAPTAGIVGDVPVRVGNQVTTSTVLTTVDQNDTLEVYVSVPEERSPDLKLGLPLRVLSGDSTRRLAETTTSFISPHVDTETQSILVKGIVRNPGAELRSSQFVRARIVWKTTQGLVIPVTAVLRLNGQNFAFIAEQAQEGGGPHLVARQRPIKLGPIAGNDYAVLDGIKPNEQVVVSGVQKLADGAPIQPET